MPQNLGFIRRVILHVNFYASFIFIEALKPVSVMMKLSKITQSGVN